MNRSRVLVREGKKMVDDGGIELVRGSPF